MRRDPIKVVMSDQSQVILFADSCMNSIELYLALCFGIGIGTIHAKEMM